MSKRKRQTRLPFTPLPSKPSTSSSTNNPIEAIELSDSQSEQSERSERNNPPSHDKEDESEEDIIRSDRKRLRRFAPSSLHQSTDPTSERSESLPDPKDILTHQPSSSPPSSLSDELSNLATSLPSNIPTSTQNARNAHKAALETLKRRRAGEPSPSPPSTYESPVLPLDTLSLSLSDPDGFSSSSGDESFISDSSTLGIPSTLIPLQFTRTATLPPRDLFTNITRSMVYESLSAPLDEGEEGVVKLSLDKLDGIVAGLAGRFISSAWRAGFVDALKAGRGMGVESTPRGEGCEACGRAHNARWKVSFEGGDEVTTFRVGKTCLSNARVAHGLVHWRGRLRDRVGGYVGKVHGGGADAEVVFEEMVGNGMVERLWRGFKRGLDEARGTVD
ncbi:hypothetical protein K470DRAFT_264786 [Piedraia hortae CBS 480.64]|uniref:DUF4211 domain-containing protein n=1 Tax=Piedraia hortae CBS 480.64 TaxID=1314780 RepID=A0A6A7BZ15_9PEZI|nr:hypothetical protein K470DRAFT_264786 [Piedraia hortae CBS 480.64]